MPGLRIAIPRRAVGTRGVIASLTAAFAIALATLGGAQAAQFVINGPPESGVFGDDIVVLPNGNIVVVDTLADGLVPQFDVGAVYLYRPNGQLINSLRGSSTNDFVGAGGIVVLANGNFLVLSPDWNNGADDVGAVTFGNASTGFAGNVGGVAVVSPSNSLVGTNANDSVGEDGVLTLTNGNYVVISNRWNGNIGAATWGSGTTGIQGAVSAANSLVGSNPGDRIGGFNSRALTNGNYVVVSPNWRNGTATDAGAVTFGSGTSGISGVVSPSNSLVGSRTADQVGSNGVVALGNGNYVVISSAWGSDLAANVGAVTFGSGTSGVSGVVSASNSLVGSTANDRVGSFGVVVLASNNYVVRSRDWDNGPVANAGAVTFGSGTTGITGTISAANSLVGSSANDLVGNNAVVALGASRYVVCSAVWDNGAIANVGAATFSGGGSGITGAVSSANSLIGSTADDNVCSGGVRALSNGNYVVASPGWDNGAIIDAGAATFASGTTGRTGAVTQANSLVGGTESDGVSGGGVVALTNGNYVVLSPLWDRGTGIDSGAATFGSGTTGISGAVSQSNSLVGSSGGDLVGNGGAVALSNGNYVVRSPSWRNGATAAAGAVTFGNGNIGINGLVTPSNSLVGSSPNDQVGIAGVIALGGGNYAVQSPNWDNNAAANAGAVTFGAGIGGVSGPVSVSNSVVGSAFDDRVGTPGVTAFGNGNFAINSSNWRNLSANAAGAITLGLSNGTVVGAITNVHSVLGTVANGGSDQRFAYDGMRNQLAIGQPRSNRVVLQRTGIATSIIIVGDTPDPSTIGQPVFFTATLSATPSTPIDGQMRFTASNGQTCTDVTPTVVSATTVNYSCAIAFNAAGEVAVTAEYFGSIQHAYSGSDFELHTTLGNTVFANSFEAP
jgi:hypothetical protein